MIDADDLVPAWPMSISINISLDQECFNKIMPTFCHLCQCYHPAVAFGEVITALKLYLKNELNAILEMYPWNQYENMKPIWKFPVYCMDFSCLHQDWLWNHGELSL